MYEIIKPIIWVIGVLMMTIGIILIFDALTNDRSLENQCGDIIVADYVAEPSRAPAKCQKLWNEGKL